MPALLRAWIAHFLLRGVFSAYAVARILIGRPPGKVCAKCVEDLAMMDFPSPGTSPTYDGLGGNDFRSRSVRPGGFGTSPPSNAAPLVGFFSLGALLLCHHLIQDCNSQTTRKAQASGTTVRYGIQAAIYVSRVLCEVIACLRAYTYTDNEKSKRGSRPSPVVIGGGIAAVLLLLTLLYFATSSSPPPPPPLPAPPVSPKATHQRRWENQIHTEHQETLHHEESQHHDEELREDIVHHEEELHHEEEGHPPEGLHYDEEGTHEGGAHSDDEHGNPLVIGSFLLCVVHCS